MLWTRIIGSLCHENKGVGIHRRSKHLRCGDLKLAYIAFFVTLYRLRRVFTK